MEKRPGSEAILPLIPCAIPLLPICSGAEPISVPFRRCWAMRIQPQPRCMRLTAGFRDKAGSLLFQPFKKLEEIGVCLTGL